MTKTIAATAIVGFISVLSAAAAQAEASAPHILKPLHGVSFEIGTKRAVSYFVRDNGACKLVVTLADSMSEHGDATFSATRFEAAVSAGKSTRYRSSEGKTLEFGCHDKAQAMSVKPIEQVGFGWTTK
ncbi:MAG: hypothetical protein ACT4OU_00705 [Hyphomicrobium sp.]